MHIKQKITTVVYFVLALLLLGGALGFTFVPARSVHADPIPTCGGGSTLVRPPNKAAYCSCPAGQFLVTGPTNVCKKSCPSGTIQGTDPSSGQAVCNPKSTSGTGSGSTSGCIYGNEPSCPVNSATDCNSAKNVITNCTDPAAASDGSCTVKTPSSCNIIHDYVDPLITVMAALVGLAVTISIVVGGIQYSTSEGDPAKATAAKNRIRNAVIALIAFIFLYAFLQFLVPGGLFR